MNFAESGSHDFYLPVVTMRLGIIKVQKVWKNIHSKKPYTLKTSSFEEIDLMLHKIYYLYQKCPKCHGELREFSDDYDKTQYLNPVKQQEHAG